MLKGHQFALLIVSDRASTGERQDQTATKLSDVIKKFQGKVYEISIVPDEPEQISQQIQTWLSNQEIDAILTSGGTGIADRDITVDVTKRLIEKELPGFGEEMRRRSLEKTPFAIISRATAGTVQGKLILNLPGSPKGAVECFEIVIKPLVHVIGVLKKQVKDCQLENFESQT